MGASETFGSSLGPATYAETVLGPHVRAGASVLCFNELALYVVGLLPDPGDVGFDTEVLKAVTKTEMNEIVRASGGPTIESTPIRLEDLATPPRRPFIVKPDFGFASQLVMRIETATDWDRFVAAAGDSSLWPLRREYADLLFADRAEILEHFLIQPDLTAARFLSVPFVFRHGSATAYVTEGASAVKSPATSFAWRVFKAPTSLSATAVERLEHDLAAVARAAGCRDGVYEAELLWTPPQHWIVEFSPRPTGGLVPELVECAYGVDIDRVAVQLLMGLEPDVAAMASADVFMGRRVEGAAEPLGEERSLVHVDERVSAGTPLRDEVWRIGP